MAEDERQTYGSAFLTVMRELEVLVRAETKETLVLFLATEVAHKIITLDLTIDRETMEHQLQLLRKWREHARGNNRQKRFELGLERIRRGVFPKRRRRRRRSKTRTVTLGSV